MINFLFNIVMALFIFMNWFFAGLGFTLFLTPPQYKRFALLLAPLIGMSLIIAISLCRSTVLLIPLSPYLDVIVLQLISLILCIWVRYKNSLVLDNYFHINYWIYLPSMLILLSIAWLFHHEGYQLLLGGSDQLQYCLNAQQMLEEMHTGSINDTPVIRYDHIILDLCTRNLTYYITYRKGAELLLANTKALSGLSYQQAFSLTIVCSLMSLGFVLNFFGRLFLYLSRRVAFFLQLAFLSTFYLLVAHVQGCLAFALAFGPYFAGMTLLALLAKRASWKLLILTMIPVAAYFSTYAETASINIVLPSLFLVLWNLYYGVKFKTFRQRYFKGSMMIILLYLLLLAYAPYAMYSVYMNFYGNFSVVLGYLQSFHLPAFLSDHHLFFQQWGLSAIFLGIASYFDDSNIKIIYYIISSPTLCLFIFLLLVTFAAWGLVKSRNIFHKLLLLFPLLFWATFALMMAFQQDGLRFSRSTEYTVTFITVGLFLLTFNRLLSRYKFSFLDNAGRWIGLFLLSIFIFTNLYTNARSISYLARHNVKNDSIIPRFETNNRLWRSIRDEVNFSAIRNKPVLISGFKETIRPVALISDFPMQPHVLGKSILKFWPLYNCRVRLPSKYFTTRLSSEAVEAGYLYQDKFFTPHPEIAMIKQSEQAVVAIDSGYPEEWLDTKDVYAPRIKRFTNIADVVYRKHFSAVLNHNMTETLKRDKQGVFRLLKKSGPIIINEVNKGTQPLTIEYNGNPNDVKLRIGSKICKGVIISKSLVRIVESIRPEEVNQLSLIVNHPVKLRSMSWITYPT